MKMILFFSISLILVLFATAFNFTYSIEKKQPFSPKLMHPSSPPIWAIHFDYPVGKPDAKGYYNAQPFGNNYHLGDDWNGNGGGNTDLGDTIYAVANGYVSFAENIHGGWGNVIRIKHFLGDFSIIESLYAHCDTIFTDTSQYVAKGTPIGTIGTANGLYPAHLHFEMRRLTDMPIGGGYSRDTTGYLNPTEFIKANR